ncbi:hypothetical protein JCM33374_g5877 [Metschnikowia sp. JCM 33374]|nr:hypothetical protein JCM33374_g5877 [Metschnikowia sp. JCM 33374]
MASPANINGSVAYSKTSGTSSPIPNSGVMPHPGYIPRGASIEPGHDRSRDYGGHPSYHMATQNHEHANVRSGNNSPVAGTGSTQAPGKSQTVFIHKLFDMLEDQSLSHLIWWSPTQDSFCLYPGEEFSNVLAQYFKHTNIASFIRQLNMYGFHKVNDNFQNEDKHQGVNGHDQGNSVPSSQQTRWEFRHSANHFRKGDVESLNLIKRKSSKVVSSQKEIVNLKTLPPTSEGVTDGSRSPKDSQSSEQYHSSVYQQSWNQLGVPGRVSSSGKEPPRQPSAVYNGMAPVMGQYPYPVYAAPVGGPNSPNSPSAPSAPEQPIGSPSYFLHSPSHAQQVSQSQSRQTSVQTPAISLESSINFKLVELSSSVNSLNVAYSDLLARHEGLSVQYHKSRNEIAQLKKTVEHLLNKAKDDDEKARKEKEDTLDRKRAHTPVNRIYTSGPGGTSPMSTQTPKSSDQAPLKIQLKSTTSYPVDSSPKRNAHKRSHSYHLNGASSGAPRVPASGIVPQQYPLNPNYSLYNNPDGTPRQPSALVGEETQAKASIRPNVNRTMSLLVDPLQPVTPNGPARSIVASTTSVTPSSANGSAQETPSSHPAAKATKDEETRPVLPQEQQPQQQQPGMPGAPPYVQQYQPYAPAHTYYQHMVNDQNQNRASSLPVMLHPLPQRLHVASPQRHSLNSLARYPAETESVTKASTSVSTTSPTISSMSRPATSKEPVSYTKPEEGTHAPMKKQLPSMEELNKSLRNGAPGLFGIHQPSDSDDENQKRRKIDE